MSGDTNDRVGELVRLLARRGRYLDAVSDGATRKRDLVTAFDVSRSTIDRAVRELADAGLLDRAHGTVSPTLRGHLARDAYRRFHGTIAGIVDAGDVLAELEDDLPLDVRLFEDATVVDAATHAPQRPITELEEILERAGHVRTLANSVIPDLVTLYRDRIVEGDLGADVVVTPEVLDVLVANHHAEVDDVVQNESVTFWLTEEPLPYGLVVASLDDRDVAVVICGQGSIAGLVTNDDPDALEWAETRFQEVRRDATRLA